MKKNKDPLAGKGGKKDDDLAYGEVKLPCPVPMPMHMLRDLVELMVLDERSRWAIEKVIPKDLAEVVYENPRGGADNPTAQLAVSAMAFLCASVN